jgi:hypothetical protein
MIAGVDELIFVVTDAEEGGFTARALGEDIFTEADDIPALHEMVRDAVRLNLEDREMPRLVRLHFVRDDVIAV